MIRSVLRVALLAAVAAFAPPVGGHHSPVAFDRSQVRPLTGTVREFQWTNPHCYIQLLVKNAKGVEEEWSLEMGAPMHLYANGWRPRTVKPGDRINVTIHPLRNGGRGGEIQAATTTDGKPLGKPA